ncbi:ORF1 [Simian torque teno virus 32]|uniref:Capsid protein n=1 Tax=Simian torque teno virus 32 TaxID=1619220 RepID=A0A0C5IBK5_9VIRU|nr:ORF1 [Simian torque teno virus 32]AJP36570.1 ORF1 [Simian torque teno virus 32]
MVYWRRRRRWWPRWRWRRTRWRRRVYRRAAGRALRRRRRRRKVRRRRYWRWRRRRRATYRRWPRRRRRRRRKTLRLTQWNPTTIVKCKIRGWFPLLETGLGRQAFNFTTHSEDIPGEKHSFGGGSAYAKFSLQLFYQEFQRNHNWWTGSNRELDLCRYLGTSIRLYRDPDISYIVSYNRDTPVVLNTLTYMSCHPLLQLLSKHHIIVASQRERPGKKRYVKLNIKPPHLMLNKWYFQQDFCPVSLFVIRASAIDLQWTWIDPGKPSPVVNFKILDPSIYTTVTNLSTKKEERNTVLNKIWNTTNGGTGNYSPAALYYYTAPTREAWGTLKKAGGVTAFGIETLNTPGEWLGGNGPGSAMPTLFNKDTETQKKFYKAVTGITPQTSYGTDITMNQKLGMYSYLFMTEKRIDPQVKGPYIPVGYLPHIDAGEGNMLWINPCSDGTTLYNSVKSKCLIKEQPLWLALYGYEDWCIKSTGDPQAMFNYYLVVRCPYTSPKLQNSSNPAQGEIPYGYYFGEGLMPNGQSPIPVAFRNSWYICLFHQRNWMETIVSSGPFIPRNYKNKSWQLTMGYNSRWLWGGVRPVTKQVQDPCSAGRHQLPDPDHRLNPVQVVDPSTVQPQLTFHGWDLRRGAFTETALRRVQEYSPSNEPMSSGPPEHPLTDVWRMPEEHPLPFARKSLFFSDTEEGSPPPGSPPRKRRKTQSNEEDQESPVLLQQPEQQLEQYLRDQLQRQRQHQRKLQKALEETWQRLARTEGHLQLDRRLL